MTIASTRLRAALLPPVLLCCAQQAAWGSDRRDTVASVTVVRPVAVTVVNNTPLQAALLTTALVPVGVVFTASNAGPVTIGVSGGASGGTSSGGPAGTAPGAGLAGSAGAGASGDDGGLVAVSGSLNGTTINGDAVSVSVDTASGGTAPGSGRVPMVIAQYN